MPLQLAKDFTPPASPTSGLQEYDQEGAQRRKKIKKEKTQCQDQNGDSVDCEDENTSDDNDGADETHAPNYEAPRQAKPKQNPNDTDELSAKAHKVSMDDKDPNSADAIGDDKDANEADAFDTNPNATGYGKKKKVKAAKKLDEGNMQKVDITTLDEPALEKFFKRHEDLFKTDELVKGVYDVACLSQLIYQLKNMADSAAYERQVEGDDSAVPENIRDEAAKLLGILSDMASEESQEITDGSTMEDVMRDTQPTMTPGLYRTDVGPMAKALRASLFGVAEEDLAKAGARNSAKDLETLQKCHDALCELGANCKMPSPHDSDGSSVDPNSEVEKMVKEVSKTDTVTSEGNKRGAAVSDPKPGENSSNAVDAENTSDQGQEKPTSDAKKGKKRMDADNLKRKSQADMDEDFGDDDDDDDEDDAPKAKKAKKSFDPEDLAKIVATAVATAMAQVMQKFEKPEAAEVQKGAGVKDPRAIPSLMAVGKDGEIGKFQAVDIDALKKSVSPAQVQSKEPWRKDEDTGRMVGDNDTVTLIKAIHASGSRFRLQDSEIPKVG